MPPQKDSMLSYESRCWVIIPDKRRAIAPAGLTLLGLTASLFVAEAVFPTGRTADFRVGLGVMAVLGAVAFAIVYLFAPCRRYMVTPIGIDQIDATGSRVMLIPWASISDVQVGKQVTTVLWIDAGGVQSGLRLAVHEEQGKNLNHRWQADRVSYAKIYAFSNREKE